MLLTLLKEPTTYYLKMSYFKLTIHAGEELGYNSSFHVFWSNFPLGGNSINFINKKDTGCIWLEIKISQKIITKTFPTLQHSLVCNVLKNSGVLRPFSQRAALKKAGPSMILSALIWLKSPQRGQWETAHRLSSFQLSHPPMLCGDQVTEILSSASSICNAMRYNPGGSTSQAREPAAASREERTEERREGSPQYCRVDDQNLPRVFFKAQSGQRRFWKKHQLPGAKPQPWGTEWQRGAGEGGRGPVASEHVVRLGRR